MNLLRHCISARRWLLCALASVMLASTDGAQAREIGGSDATLRLGQDWERGARWAWDDASKGFEGAQLHAWAEANPNRFFDANIQNTFSQRPGEYETVGQRHSYYDYMAYYLEYSQAAPQATRGVRFFAATTSVTIRAELGLLDYMDAHASGDLSERIKWMAKRLDVDEQSIRTLANINQLLFDKNMRVIRDLIQIWKVPRDPRAVAPRDTMTAFEFDMAMVDFEQSAVQGYLDANSVSSRQVDAISALIKRMSHPMSLVAQMQGWSKKAGYQNIDFGDKAWRVAIGRALVFRFHNKDEAQYLKYMKDNPVSKNARTGMYDGMQAPASYSASTQGSFTVLGSWKTKKGAMRHLAELKNQYAGLQAAVFPPAAPNMYWTVMGSSYVSRDTAWELARRAKRERLARDAFAITRNAVGVDGIPQRPVAGSANVYVPVDLISFRSAGPGAAIDPLRTKFLTIFETSVLDEARETYAYYRTSFPDLQISLYEISGTYYVAFAAFATEAELELAKRAARHAGVALDSVKEWSSGADRPIQRINAQGEAFKAIWEEVQACYSAGIKDGDRKISPSELHECSGMWFTPTTLTRCFTQDNCEGLGDDVLKTMEQVRAFYEGQQLDYDQLVLKVAIDAIPLPKDSVAFVNAMVNCRSQSNGNKSDFMRCVAGQMPNAAATNTALLCMKADKSVQQVLDCMAANNAFPTEMAEKVSCFTADYVDDAAVARCMLGTVEQDQLDTATNCLRSASGKGFALTQCLGRLLKTEDQRKVNCLAGHSGRAADTVSCLLPPGDAKKTVQAIQCASRLGIDPKDAAQCVAQLAGGDDAMVAACAVNAETGEAAVACMLAKSPEASAAYQAYACASGGTSAADLIANCTGDALDPKAKALASCVAKGNSDDFAGTAATCAAGAILPPELASVAGCVAKSTGGVDAVLCVAAPQMNAETRIAMECASSTGGEPISFAGCTAGRLTAKELELCLSGKIGGPGGCFGDGNTLVIGLRNIANDLQYGPGDNNEYVKAARALESFVRQRGKELENAWDQLFGPNSDFCRGDLTGWACPGKTSDWCRGDLTSWTC